MSITVKTQSDLDAALEAGESVVYIESPKGVRLRIIDTGNSNVIALGSSLVKVLGNSRIEAWDNSHVEARNNSHVSAWGNSRIMAGDSSHIEAWGNSRIEAWCDSYVEARDSSHVVARGSSNVVAWDYSHIEAGKWVSVHLYSTRVAIDGGVVIDMTNIDLYQTDQWLEYNGIKITDDGKAILFKAVYDNWQTERGPQWTYAPGNVVTADDYHTRLVCGGGLHLSPSPSEACRYLTSASRYVACEVDVDTIVPLEDKCKVREARVLYEVTITGEPIL